jgi:hypothetical protein
MNQISECCDAPLVYHIWEMENKSIGYEPWDFCPECLECCSGYDPQEKDRIKQLTEGANDDTIKRANKRLAKDLGFGRKDNDVDSQDDSIRDGFLYGPQQCAP